MKPKTNPAYSSLKFILIDLVGDILYWPLWWYSKGLLKTALFCFDEIKDWEELLGLRIWIKNLFTPMFGQYDIEGRIISFFVRLIQIIFRAFFLLIWSVIILSLIVIWVVAPIYIFYQIINNFLWIF